MTEACRWCNYVQDWLTYSFFLNLHLLLAVKMKQMPLEIRWEMQFPTSCSDACSGLNVKILSTFHGGLAHFLQSNCSTVYGTEQELGQLSTEATSGAGSEICPDNNKVDNKGNKTLPTLTWCTVPVQFVRHSRNRMQQFLQYGAKSGPKRLFI